MVRITIVKGVLLLVGVVTIASLLFAWGYLSQDKSPDTNPPILSQIDDKVIDIPDESGARIHYDLPVVADDVGVIGVPYCDPPSGEKFPLGTTTVRCFAYDAAGNEGTTSFKIILNQSSRS